MLDASASILTHHLDILPTNYPFCPGKNNLISFIDVPRVDDNAWWRIRFNVVDISISRNILMRISNRVVDVLATFLLLNHARPTLLPPTRRLLFLLLWRVMWQCWSWDKVVEEDVWEMLYQANRRQHSYWACAARCAARPFRHFSPMFANPRQHNVKNISSERKGGMFGRGSDGQSCFHPVPDPVGTAFWVQPFHTNTITF